MRFLNSDRFRWDHKVGDGKIGEKRWQLIDMLFFSYIYMII